MKRADMGKHLIITIAFLLGALGIGALCIRLGSGLDEASVATTALRTHGIASAILVDPESIASTLTESDLGDQSVPIATLVPEKQIRGWELVDQWETPIRGRFQLNEGQIDTFVIWSCGPNLIDESGDGDDIPVKSTEIE